MPSANAKTFTPKDAPITKVVVYRDRAEITRLLRLKAPAAGLQDVVLASLPTRITLESLRVEGRGPASIMEVNLSDSVVKKDERSETDQKEKKYRDTLETLKERKAVQDTDIALLEKQQSFWDQCADSLARDVFAVKDGKSHLIETDTFENLSSFLGVHAREKSKLDVTLREKRAGLEKLQQDIQVAEQNLNECCYGSNQQMWSIIVSLDVHGEGELELTFSYIVYGAYWNPKYDVRVSPENKKLSIAYYGLITQNTGEDWVEVPLSLSTAVPSQGGTIPTLGTKTLSFKQPPPPPQPVPQYAIANFGGFGGGENMRMKRSMVQDSMQAEFCAAPMMASVARVVQDAGITTSFEIVKPSTIPTDGSEHKVTVGILELEPSMQYKSIPKKVEQAFLEAKALNTSPYPILPGPASVFFGSNFVASVDLKTVSPQEDFTCSLGVDPAVRVKYRPVRRFNEQTGMLSKTSVVTYIQEIEVNNTRPDTVHVVLIDQVPRSTEEKLRVTLVEPALSLERREAKGFLINEDNNLEHEVDVKGHSKYLWTIKYKLEYPSDKEIEETEVQGSQ
ncbi:putative Protein F37C4.5 [Hypsibius exemplaris]|uniref:Protein F37C4.5 n=1 Tax=Hypsibius exemplaris TaxID=2072580 RepID=A0A9X6NEB9_HYPEX|nr:putative Protein F37C4.5 [Hypsibius exemplaris]